MTEDCYNDDEDNDDSDNDENDGSSLLLLQRRRDLEDLLATTLPLEHVVYAFGYGSGIFPQTLSNDNNHKDKTLHTDVPVRDVIIVVDDTLAFHKANYDRNPDHYWTPPVWLLSTTTITNNNNNNNGDTTTTTVPQWYTHWQKQHGNLSSSSSSFLRDPGVCFHLSSGLKYGVVHVNDLCDDLRDWRYLYVAGRMQKPILPLFVSQNNNNNHNNHDASSINSKLVHLQTRQNLPAALACALLLVSLKESNKTRICVPEDAIYRQIAELSYRGDLRRTFRAEDPLKIERLVHGPGQLQQWRRHYQSAWKQLRQTKSWPEGQFQAFVKKKNDTMVVSWQWDGATQHYLSSFLPAAYQLDDNTNKDLATTLARTVAATTRYQSCKGIITAGPQQAWRYAWRKLAKGRR